MHEIITLQLGQTSNYVATHFWNTQESYFTYNDDEESPVDHNVHFRPGLGAGGTETFVPRTLIYDLKGGFGNLRKYNALYQVEEKVDPKELWEGNEIVQRQPEIPQTEYQRSLDLGLQPPRLTSEAVRYWSDFTRVFYHPDSIIQLNEHELNSQLTPFENWTTGEELFNSLDKEHDILDRDMRHFAEECDQLRAFQIFSGTDDAWGGFTARYIDALADEFGRKDIWVWAIEDGSRTQPTKKTLAAANSARSLNEISPLTSAYVPIRSPPHDVPSYLNGDLQSKWYSSALLSMAVESVTLPARLHHYRGLDHWPSGGERSRKVLDLQFAKVGDKTSVLNGAEQARGRQEEGGYDLSQKLLDDFEIDFSPFSPVTSSKEHVFAQTRVTRDSKTPKDGATEEEDVNGLRRQQIENMPEVRSFYTSLEFPILDSFPDDLINHQGQTGSTVATRAALSTTTRLGKQIKELRRFAGRAVQVDERETLMNGLAEIGESYEHAWESGSDSGEDD